MIKFCWNFKCIVPFFVQPFVTGSYLHTKFGCKNISATENRTENIPWSFQSSPWLWLWTQQSNVSQVTPDYDDVLSNYIWLQKDRAALKIYIAGMIIFDYINPHSDLDTDHSKTIFSKTLWLMMMHHHTKFGHKT